MKKIIILMSVLFASTIMVVGDITVRLPADQLICPQTALSRVR